MSTENNNDIYDKLFDISLNNLKRAGKELTIPKKAYIAWSKADPMTCDILELLKIDATNEEFIHILYLSILNRPIDEKALEMWKTRFSLPKAKFRRAAVEQITSSEEYAKKGKIITNNIYADTGRYKDIIPRPNFFYGTAYKIYHKMPEPFKNIIRKARGIK